MKKLAFTILCTFTLAQAAPSDFNLMKTFVELGIEMGFGEDEITLKELNDNSNLDLDEDTISTNVIFQSMESVKNGYKLNVSSDDINASAFIDLSDNKDILEAVKDIRDEITSDSELTLKNNDIKEEDFIKLAKKELSSLKAGDKIDLICSKFSKIDGELELEDCFLKDIIINFTSQVLSTSLDKKDLQSLSSIFELMIGKDAYNNLKLETKEQRKEFIDNIMKDDGDDEEEDLAN